MKTRTWLVSTVIAAILIIGTVWAVDGQSSCPKENGTCTKQEKDKQCDKEKKCDKDKECDKAKQGCPKEGAGCPKK